MARVKVVRPALALAEFTEKKSKFIGHAAPAADEDEARDFVRRVKKTYPDARHNVFAYITGGREKSSDDGEPGGTAGMPLLFAMKARELSDSVIVVTRYFGGIKLGTGGLTRAYGAAARMTTEAAETVRLEARRRLVIRAGYDVITAAESYLRGRGLSAAAEYAERVTLTALVAPEDADAVAAGIADATSGRAEVADGGMTEDAV